MNIIFPYIPTQYVSIYSINDSRSKNPPATVLPVTSEMKRLARMETMAEAKALSSTGKLRCNLKPRRPVTPLMTEKGNQPAGWKVDVETYLKKLESE